MIRINNENYYTCTEMAKAMEADNPEFRELHKKFCEVYDKPLDSYMYDVYIQSKLFPAIRKKYIRYAKVQKNTRTLRVFSIKDVINFLERPDAKHVTKKYEVSAKDVTIVEVGQ